MNYGEKFYYVPKKEDFVKKIHYIHEKGGKKITFYMKFQNFKMDGKFFNAVGNKVEKNLFEEMKFPQTTLRYYWLDKEGDEIEILNDEDFSIYLSYDVKSLWITPKHVSDNAKEDKKTVTVNGITADDYDPTEFVVHEHVECNNCLMLPIVGFRYKCIQCQNYDLCQNCEGKHVHAEHMMMRMPNTNCVTMLDSLLMAGCGSGRKHGKRFKTSTAQCPFWTREVGLEAALGSESEGCAANNDPAKDDNNKDRHRCRKQRRHLKRHGIFSHFYDIMQDLAEGGGEAAPQTCAAHAKNAVLAAKVAQKTANQAAKAAATAVTAAMSVTPLNKEEDKKSEKGKKVKQSATTPTTTINNNKKDKINTKNDSVQTNNDNANAPRKTAEETKSESSNSVANAASLLPLETLLDPHFMKTGIQILNNFSDMFAKMLDPVEVGIDNDTNYVDKTAKTPPSTPTSTNEKMATSTKINYPEEGLEKSTQIDETEQTETEMYKECEIEDVSDTDSDSLSETFIKLDRPIDDMTADGNVEKNIDKAKVASEIIDGRAKSYVADFAELRASLKAHIDEESIKNGQASTTTAVDGAGVTADSVLVTEATTTTTNSKSTTTTNTEVKSTPTSNERRAVLVYHADPIINHAVHHMMFMGFSNENGVLTNLLESVNGNISEALDLISTAQI